MTRYIGKCRTCKTVSARDYNEKKTELVGTGMYQRTASFFGRTRNEHFVYATEDCECPNCSKPTWHGKAVKGFVTGHKCGPKCTEAKGFMCECQCGGKNHGAGHLVCVEIAA